MKIIPQVKLTLPWPPSVNHYYYSWRGRMVISKRGKEYLNQVKEAIQDQNIVRLNLDGKLIMWKVLYPPDLRRRDIDNYSKALLDAIHKNDVIADDRYIKISHTFWMNPIPKGKVNIAFQQIDEVILPTEVQAVFD